jgi:hypothetical protein
MRRLNFVLPQAAGRRPNVAVHDAKEGDKKRHKQHPQWVMTMADYDGSNDEKAGGSGVGLVTTVARSGKRLARPPMDHLERLLEEACRNHAYPVKHKLKLKLKDYDMMKNSMVSESLARGMELDEVSG